ncbi:hypothetical protein CONPUDRAFT_95732 [Coniophora puteana RWD-64-598 SS2]|uniref:Nucleic acid-binding protein n=1 Tax=Coniophora puteana (strain RWD-64-598) TaxID=741705 RepID=A0A5M3N7K0_CONPW|nr:uncharacterized protein CONPUDRAFT_95732 [Coniophora puteana RWD-64-598 SS2]EIW86831.1 hypothetical protein CONPUDRAFT_95732 [Coniophora puteana RWD-64-598 SS2]
MPPMAFTGTVTKVGFMNKTATVTVSRWIIHKITGKRIERSTKILSHDEKNGQYILHDCHTLIQRLAELRLNDVVSIRNCPPISARKRFRLEKVLHSPEGERELAHRAQTMMASSSS